MPLFKSLVDLIARRGAPAETVTKAPSARSWTAASLSPTEKRHDGKPPPFTQGGAVRFYSSWIYAAANINANAVASTPLRLYIRSRGGRAKLWKTKKASYAQRRWMVGDARHQPSAYVMRKAAELGSDFEEVTDSHPLLQLMARSNPYINGYDLTVLRVAWQELTGNAYLHIVTDPTVGVPTELWPMPPQWTTIVPDERDFISVFKYGRSPEKSVDFDPSEVIHFKRPNPSDLFYGMGKLQASWGAANSNEALHEMDLAFFKNKARPDYAMIVKGNASQDQLDGLETQIQSKLRGTDKTGHFLITTADLDLKPLQFPPKDMQGRDEIVEEIAAVFGVPVSMLKANDPNLASAEAGFASWRESTVLPLCRMDEETLNQRLLPLFGLEEDAVLAYDNPVRSNRQMDLAERQAAVAGGWMTPNEAREAQGLEPITDDPSADRLRAAPQPQGAPPAGGAPAGAPLPPSAPEGTGGLPAAPVAAAYAGPIEAKCGCTDAAAEPVHPARVKAATDLLGRIADGSISAPAATELIVALGFARPTAELLVTSQAKSVQQAAADDCVSSKISKLVAEGYPQDQAVAIAISMCSEQRAGIEDAAITKDCGTGAGGFKEGNTCGGGRGDGAGSSGSSKPSGAPARVPKLRESKVRELGVNYSPFPSLEDTNSGADFAEMGVESMRDMINHAYALGQRAAGGDTSKKPSLQRAQRIAAQANDKFSVLTPRRNDSLDFHEISRSAVRDVIEAAYLEGAKDAGKSKAMDDECIEQKDCGTGAGGFKEGNTCGGADGEGGKRESKPRAAKTPKQLIEDAPETSATRAAWQKAAAVAYAEDSEFRAMVDGVSLFTQGSYGEVQRYAREMDSGTAGDVTVGRATHPLASYKPMVAGQDLEKSTVPMREAVTAIRKAIQMSKPIEEMSRGIRMPMDPKANAAIGEFLANAKAGDSFDIDVPTSFTADRKVAEQFAQGINTGRSSSRRDPMDGVVFVVKGAKGLRAAAMSPWNQKEVISEGRFKVTAIDGERPQKYNVGMQADGSEAVRWMWGDRDAKVRMVVTLEPA